MNDKPTKPKLIVSLCLAAYQGNPFCVTVQGLETYITMEFLDL